MEVLIADDEHDITHLYKRALEKAGHSATIVSDGPKCLKVYNQNHCKEGPGTARRIISYGCQIESSAFDAVVLDYKMPGLEGIDVVP